MPSPLHDLNHLRLSRKIADPVAAAATDGSEVSSALRNDYLNKASNFIQLYFKTNRLLAQLWIPGLIDSASVTFSSSGASTPSDYSYWISLKRGTNSVGSFTYFPPDKKSFFDDQLGWNSIAAGFTELGGKIYAYQDNIPITSGTGTLIYVKTDVRANAGDTADIAIDKIWHDIIVDIAATYHFEDKTETTHAAQQEKRVAIILGVINAKS
jgi:hypothetical protein